MKGSKRVLLVVIAAFIIIGVAAFGISLALNNDGNFLRNQKVDGLSFENAKVEYKNNKSDFSVIVYNENDESYDVKEIKINLKDKNGKIVTMVADINGSLESDEGRLITATTDVDITNMASLKYEISR